MLLETMAPTENSKKTAEWKHRTGEGKENNAKPGERLRSSAAFLEGEHQVD